jgi:hypothetical protein
MDAWVNEKFSQLTTTSKILNSPIQYLQQSGNPPIQFLTNAEISLYVKEKVYPD